MEIESYIKNYPSAKKAYRAFRADGGRMQYQKFLALRREILGIEQNERLTKIGQKGGIESGKVRKKLTQKIIIESKRNYKFKPSIVNGIVLPKGKGRLYVIYFKAIAYKYSCGVL